MKTCKKTAYIRAIVKKDKKNYPLYMLHVFFAIVQK